MYSFSNAAARPATNRLIDMMDAGEIDARAVADMCLGWLAEASVKEMMLSNDIIEEDADEDDDDIDDDIDDNLVDERDE